MDGKKVMADFVFASTYARYNSELKRRETFEEAVERMRAMHKTFYADTSDELHELIDESFNAVASRKVLASQRALQFGGDPVLKHNMRIYNCATSYCDRLSFFSEAFYMGLCGVGVGFSVQRIHTDCLPPLLSYREISKKDRVPYKVRDSIEGWADALLALIDFYFSPEAPYPEFDFSDIRPLGAEISAGGTAPGSVPLETALNNVENLIEGRVEDQRSALRPIDCFDLAMFSAEAVLSGGRRRAATIALFDIDDQDMLNAKTGYWFNENKQRGLANISAVVLTNGEESREDFNSLIESTKKFGEPGVIFSKSPYYAYNPCVEIGMCPMLIRDDRGEVLEEYTLDHLNNRSYWLNKGYSYESGWQTCNLTEINGKRLNSAEDLVEAARHAATIGTLQAGYTSPNYLCPVSQQIIEREALLGVSITGIMDNPELLLDPDVLKMGAEEAVRTNAKVSGLIGIRKAARVTCVKPAGTTSILLGTSSGIHPHFGRQVIRHIQVNKQNPVYQEFQSINPDTCEESMWSANGSDAVVAFPLENDENCVIKGDLTATEFINHVNTVQRAWVLNGTQRPESCEQLNHNVSNTVAVLEDEWGEVTEKLWSLRNELTGIALLGDTGEMLYSQLPNQVVYTREELEARFGAEAVSLALQGDHQRSWEVLDASKDPEALKYHIDGLQKLNKLREALSVVDYAQMFESHDTTSPTQDSACSGQSCEVKYV